MCRRNKERPLNQRKSVRVSAGFSETGAGLVLHSEATRIRAERKSTALSTARTPARKTAAAIAKSRFRCVYLRYLTSVTEKRRSLHTSRLLCPKHAFTMPLPAFFTLNNGLSIPAVGLGTWVRGKTVTIAAAGCQLPDLADNRMT